jgi:hypothetical protein
MLFENVRRAGIRARRIGQICTRDKPASVDVNGQAEAVIRRAVRSHELGGLDPLPSGATLENVSGAGICASSVVQAGTHDQPLAADCNRNAELVAGVAVRCNGSSFDEFGVSVAISGNRLVVGALFDDAAGALSGSARGGARCRWLACASSWAGITNARTTHVEIGLTPRNAFMSRSNARTTNLHDRPRRARYLRLIALLHQVAGILPNPSATGAA